MQKPILINRSASEQAIANIEKACHELSNHSFQNVIGDDLPRVINPESPAITMTLLAEVNERTVSEALKPPSIGGIDINPFTSDQEIAAYVLSCADLGGIILSTTSNNFLNHELLPLFVERAIEGLAIPKDNLALVKTALNEALQNGIVHGNFKLSTSDLTTIDDFIEFETAIKERANIPEYGLKKLLLRSWHNEQGVYFSIIDEGDGFDFENSTKPYALQPLSSNKKSNRGLLIIKEIADHVEQCMNGRCLTMRFYFVSSRKEVIAPEPIVEPIQEPNQVPTPSPNQWTEDTDVINEDELFASKILIVDDDNSICVLIQAFLNAGGFQNIGFAYDGEVGLAKIKELKPDIVILDINMPIMNGIEVLKVIRADQKFNDMPIIVQTAQDGYKDRNEALRNGASNLISKPIDSEVLISRVRFHLERQNMINNLKSYQQRVHEELDAARSMQYQLLPSQKEVNEIEKLFNVKLNSHFQPSSEIGGDYWGVQYLSPKRVGIYNVDFSGHGVGAAINTFRLHSMMSKISFPSDDPASYLKEINDALVDLIPTGQFATMVYAIIDQETDMVIYSASGSTSPIFGHADNQELILADASGIPLGITTSANYTNREVAFPPGSYMFLYSDALLETPGKTSSFLGEEGLVELVRQSIITNTENPLKALLKQFFKHSVPQIPDDLTAIWLQRAK